MTTRTAGQPERGPAVAGAGGSPLRHTLLGLAIVALALCALCAG